MFAIPYGHGVTDLKEVRNDKKGNLNALGQIPCSAMTPARSKSVIAKDEAI